MILMLANFVFGKPIPVIVFTAIGFLWVFWFAMWATKGGMPRMRA